MSNETQTVLEDDQAIEGVQIGGDADDSPQGDAEDSQAAQVVEEGAATELGNDVDELIVTIEGEEQQEEDDRAAPSWVRELRKRDREKSKRLRELEEENNRLKGGAAPSVDDPGKEPELEDFDYDADQFKAAFKEWTTKKAQVEQKKEAIRRQQEEAAKEWQAVQETYAKGKARFPKEKMAEAEEEVVSVLSGPRQAMLMDMADDSAQLVIALGSSPETLRKLAAIKSDAKFIKELAKVEMNVKVQPKKTPPPPERTISGSGKTPGATANKLDSLRAEAEKSGDYSKYFAEKRRLGK